MALLPCRVKYTTMAKAKGIIQIIGTIGGVTYYLSNGKYLAKNKGGGFSTTANKTYPHYERVRENGLEFGGSTRAAKFFRQAFGPYLKRPFMRGLCPRTVKLMQHLVKFDMSSVRGKRVPHIGIHHPQGKALLCGFEMNPAAPVSRLLKAPFVMDAAAGVLTIAGLGALNIAFPKGATAAGIMLQAISFDFESDSAFAVSPEAFVAKGAAASDLSLQVATPVIAGQGNQLPVVFYVLHVRFYQEVNQVSVPYNDEGTRAMTVIAVL